MIRTAVHTVAAFAFILVACTGLAVAGEMPVSSTETFDADGDGVADTTITWTVAGEVVCKSMDRDKDGVADRLEHRSYDASGNLVEKAIDRNADGVIDAMTRYAYDAEGREVARVFDQNADSVDDRRRVIGYDASGAKVLLAVDQGADGTFEVVKTWVDGVETAVAAR